jgi:hypothetical protein
VYLLGVKSTAPVAEATVEHRAVVPATTVAAKIAESFAGLNLLDHFTII